MAGAGTPLGEPQEPLLAAASEAPHFLLPDDVAAMGDEEWILNNMSADAIRKCAPALSQSLFDAYCDGVVRAKQVFPNAGPCQAPQSDLLVVAVVILPGF